MDQLNSTDSEEVTADEYLLVASALNASGLSERSLGLLYEAKKIVHDATNGVAVDRGIASIEFDRDNQWAGRLAYERALHVFERFPNYSLRFKSFTHTLTELYWAQSELSARECSEARKHLDRAREHWNPYHDPASDSLMDQLKQTQRRAAHCRAPNPA